MPAQPELGAEELMGQDLGLVAPAPWDGPGWLLPALQAPHVPPQRIHGRPRWPERAEKLFRLYLTGAKHVVPGRAGQ